MKRNREKGAALLTVLVALMIITILLFEFQYSAMVERKLAYNDLNQTQAYYLAKSGARIGLLRVALYARLKNNPQIKSMVKDPNLLNPFLDQIWQMPIPPFPPDAATMKEMFKSDRDAAQKVLEQTKIEEGTYSVTIRSESSKINLNSLVVPTNKLSERPNFTVPPDRPDLYSGLMLVNLMEGFLRDSDDAYAEYPNLRPEEQVMDIMDWVSPGDNRLMGGSKDQYYETQNPPYKAKRGRLFTLDELRLVKGIDDNLFEKLRPHVTVYSYDSKINLNSADEKMYRAIYRDFTDDDLKKIMEQRTQLGNWGTEKQFVDFVVQTLGRNGFATLYPNAADYPFTVGTESFLIESLGVIQKSASSVQRTITVAAAFTSGRGGQILQGVTDPAACTKVAGQYWNKALAQCFTAPRNQQECVNLTAGTWMQQGGKDVCKINQNPGDPPIFADPTAGAGGKGAKANSLKVLYWHET